MQKHKIKHIIFVQPDLLNE